MRLGTTNANTDFQVQDSSEAVKLNVDASGQVDIAGNFDVTGGIYIEKKIFIRSSHCYTSENLCLQLDH